MERSVVGKKPNYSSKPLLRFDRAALYYADVYIFLSVCKAFYLYGRFLGAKNTWTWK